MGNKLFQFHWFDKDVHKLLERYDIQSESAQQCMDRMLSLAQAAYQSSVSMVLLADFHTYKVKSAKPLEPEEIEKLVDLGHLLKEVETDLWTRFSTEPFFTGSELWQSIQDFKYFFCQPIITPEDKILGWLCIFDYNLNLNPQLPLTMVTLAEMMMDELVLRVQIKRSSKIQNEIIHLAAHDLKNPLSGILGITDHIKKQIHDAEQVDEICGLIKDSSKRMMHILDDILKSGYLESGKISIKAQPGSFSDLIEKVIQTNLHAAQRKKQTFKVTVAEQLWVLMDRHRMEEVLDNLVNNAVKYAPIGSSIQIGMYEQEGKACFSIYNSGVGLSEDDKGNIFFKFSRLSAKPTGGEGSTGLGLSIVKMLAEMHGGTIEANSDGIDQGVEFLLRIPSLAQMV